ncbi:MAG: hypothetical protein CSA65_01940 [Proteobacteria bacterium]|nr:MAG: hypothetical protein CSA65_01940 [Pseudomonadota bacterium]
MGARLRIEQIEISRNPDREWLELRNRGDRPFIARDCSIVVEPPQGRPRHTRIGDPFVLEPGRTLRLVSGKGDADAPVGRHYLFSREALFSGVGDVVRLMHRQREVCSTTVQPRSKRQWIKHRPKVSVQLSGDRKPGGQIDADISVETKRAVWVNSVSAELRGSYFARVGAGRSSHSKRYEFLRLHADVCGASELPEGLTQQRVQFCVPDEAPPSINASGLQVTYTLQIHIDIPWWPDRYALFDVPIEFPLDHASRDPVVLVSDEKGPYGKGPYAELSLARTEISTGSSLAGAIALYNVENVRYRQVALALQRRHRVVMGHRDSDYFQRIDYTLSLPTEPIEGDAIPFSLTLPSRLAPTYRAASMHDTQWFLDWSLIVRVETAWWRDLRFDIPLKVVCGDEQRPPEQLAAPSIGSKRLAELWASVAERQRLQLQDGHLELETDHGTLTVQRQRDDEDHLLLTAELRLAQPLGLGLDVQEAHGLRRFGGHDLGVPSFDRRHLVRGHDAEQILYLLAPLISDWPERYRLNASDEALRLSIPGGGYQRGPLEALCQRARTWLERIPEQRRSVPFPKALRDRAGWWHQLEGRLGSGKLDRGAVCVSGRQGGREVSLAVSWSESGKPRGLRLTVQGQPLEDYQLSFEGGSLGRLSRLPGAARERIARLLAGLCGPARLLIDSRGVHLYHPDEPELEAAGHARGEGSCERALDRCAALGELLPFLEGQSGPYR